MSRRRAEQFSTCYTHAVSIQVIMQLVMEGWEAQAILTGTELINKIILMTGSWMHIDLIHFFYV